MSGSVKVMGIVNVTPDSFSDGGRFLVLKWPSGTVRRQVLVATQWFGELRARVGGLRFSIEDVSSARQQVRDRRRAAAPIGRNARRSRL